VFAALGILSVALLGACSDSALEHDAHDPALQRLDPLLRERRAQHVAEQLLPAARVERSCPRRGV
jgi:hypothetical protein